MFKKGDRIVTPGGPARFWAYGEGGKVIVESDYSYLVEYEEEDITWETPFGRGSSSGQ